MRGYGTARYLRERAALLADDPICVHCRRRPATEGDHQPPLSMHVHSDGGDCCVLVPSCGPCAREQGGLIRTSAPMMAVALPEVVELEEPPGFDADHEVWDVPWLDSLRDVPDNATWPRLMTVPHPRAVGSLGSVAADFALERRGRPWRWWQRLYVTRLLEVDEDGLLVWETSLLTVARQVGKTWLVADVCGWRQESEHFDTEQLILSTGKDIAVCREMQRPARVRAKARRDAYKVREVNGQEEIERLDTHSRWMVRAKESVYGISATLATVDESWKVAAAIVDEGIIPTMVEQDETQLLLVSTAHRRATALMIGRRASALAELASGEGSLIVEWSAPPDAELDDRAGWRLASPHWTPKRERWIADRLTAALAGESDDLDEPDPIAAFRAQWLNQWPGKRTPVSKGEELIPAPAWTACAGPVSSDGSRIWIGVEDNYGAGVAVAAAVRLVDGRVGVDGWTVETVEEAIAHVRELAAGHARVRLMVGATVVRRIPSALRPQTYTSAQTRTGLAALRELVDTGAIVHEPSPDLDRQMAGARVTRAATGLMLVGGTRTDLVRAVSWVAQEAAQPVKIPAIA
jgi:hypothetical protein